MKNTKAFMITLLVVLLSLGFASTTLGNEGEPPPPDIYPGSLTPVERTLELPENVRFPWLSVQDQFNVTEESETEEFLIQPKIIGGGSYTPQNLYPFIASLQLGGFHYCGGVLITPGWVLTSGHCWTDGEGNAFSPHPDLDRVVLGEYSLSTASGNEQSLAVAEVIIHPQYNHNTFAYDFALLRLATPATLNSYVQPIKLATTALGILDNKDATIIGWGSQTYPVPSGFTAVDTIQRAYIKILPNSGCDSYGIAFDPTSMICGGYEAGGTDTCQGDSGGPMFTNIGGTNYVAGVTSWGNGCALPDFPGVYAKVSSAINWIKSVTNPPVTILSPTGTVSDATPLYQWQHNLGATFYQFVIKENGTDVVHWKGYNASSICSGSTCTLNPTFSLYDGTFTMLVLPRTFQGDGTWSSVNFSISGSVPDGPPGRSAIISPTGTITNAFPQYKWHHLQNATEYIVIIKNNGTKTVHWQGYSASQLCAGDTCTLIPEFSLYDGMFTMQVLPKNSFGDGEWNKITFNVTGVGPGDPPGVVTIIAPSDVTTEESPLIQWNKVSNATYYEMAIKENGTSVVHWSGYPAAEYCSGTVCTVSGIDLYDGYFMVQVLPKNIYGNGVWKTKYFTVDTSGAGSPPGQATLIAPSGTITTATPLYQWHEVPSATSYVLIVRLDGASTALHWQGYNANGICSSGVCSVTPTFNLYDGYFSMSVLPRNSYGDGVWNVQYFTVTGVGSGSPPGQTTILAPPSTTADRTPLIQWSAVTGATVYEMAIKENGTTVVHWAGYDPAEVCSAGVCSVDPSFSLYPGDFKVQVLPRNAYGTGGWSEKFFTITP